MDELFERFIKERKYLHNLTEGALCYYREVYGFFKAVGFDGSKKSHYRAQPLLVYVMGSASPCSAR